MRCKRIATGASETGPNRPVSFFAGKEFLFGRDGLAPSHSAARDTASRVSTKIQNIDAALNGTKNINDVITAVEPRLWNMSTVLPILQDTTIVAAGPSVQNVSLAGAVPVGIVGDAGQWVKSGP